MRAATRGGSPSCHAATTSTAAGFRAATPTIAPDARRPASPQRHRRVTAWLRRGLLHQLVELRGGLDAEPVAQQAATELVLPHGLAAVAFGEVDADQRAMSALAQRFAAYCRERGLQRPAQAAVGGELLRERLERVQAELAEALALEQQPVVVPVRQELAEERELAPVEILAARGKV